MNDKNSKAAKYYRDMFDWITIPIKRGKKNPNLPKGHEFLKRRPTDEELAAFVFENVGIVTGSISGIIVLDLERKNDKDGIRTLEQYGWEVPETATASTPTGGGRHLYLKYPGFHVRNRTGKGELAPGVEVKGDGGYVLAPPSEVEWTENEKGDKNKVSGAYEWVHKPEEVGIAECPEWLLQELRKASERTNEPRDWAEALAGVPEGERDIHLWEVAWRAAYAGLPQAWAERLIVETANNCTPPFDRDVALEKVARAYTTTTTTPSPVPPEVSQDVPEPCFTASDLMEEEIPEMKWVVPDILPEGVTILAGKPKVGKSWLALGLWWLRPREALLWGRSRLNRATCSTWPWRTAKGGCRTVCAGS